MNAYNKTNEKGINNVTILCHKKYLQTQKCFRNLKLIKTDICDFSQLLMRYIKGD